MSTTLKKSMIAAGFALGSASLCASPSAFALSQEPVTSAPYADQYIYPDGPEAGMANQTRTLYNCELGDKVTVFHNGNDDSHISLLWKERIYRLDKVGTATGVRRFENAAFGLTWIGIPAKAILLDSKQMRQLANECKNADQENGELATVPEQPAPID